MAEILQLNDQEYIAGLFWQTLSVGDDFDAVVQDRAHELNRDLACSVRFPAPQAGFLNEHELPDEASARPYSLGGHLLKSQLDDWVGVFKVGSNSYYFIAVQNNMILQKADTIGTHEEISEQFYNLVRSAQGRSWDRIIVPNDITIEERDPDWEERDLEVFLADITDPAPYLEPVEFEWTTERIVGVSIAGLIALGLLWLLFGLPAMPDVSGWFESEQTKKQKKAKNKQEEKATFSPPPFARYTPSSVISDCWLNKQDIPYSTRGYQMRSYTCEPTRITALYDRKHSDVLPGQLESFFDKFRRRTPVQGINTFDGPRRLDFKPSTARYGPTKQVLKRIFESDITALEWTTPQKDPYNAPDCGEDSEMDVCVVRFTIKSDVSPRSIKRHLEQPGLYLRSMTRYFGETQRRDTDSQADRPWFIQGGIYFAQ